jgi:hypothetical protein
VLVLRRRRDVVRFPRSFSVLFLRFSTEDPMDEIVIEIASLHQVTSVTDCIAEVMDVGRIGEIQAEH